MKIKFLLIVGVVTLCVVAASQNIYSKSASNTIFTSIGMSIEDIEMRSTSSLKFVKDSNGYSEYQENISHDLKVVSGKLVFVLPKMQSIAMQAIDGKLVHVDDRPSVGLLSLDEALRWSESVISLMKKTGWREDTSLQMTLYSGELGLSFPSTAALRKAFLNPKMASGLTRIRVATWRNGADIVRLEIVRKGPVNLAIRNLAEDKVYFATVYIGADKLTGDQNQPNHID